MYPADYETRKTIMAFEILSALGERISSSEFIMEGLPIRVLFRIVEPCREDLVRTLLDTVLVRHTNKGLTTCRTSSYSRRSAHSQLMQVVSLLILGCMCEGIVGDRFYKNDTSISHTMSASLRVGIISGYCDRR